MGFLGNGKGHRVYEILELQLLPKQMSLVGKKLGYVCKYLMVP